MFNSNDLFPWAYVLLTTSYWRYTDLWNQISNFLHYKLNYLFFFRNEKSSLNIILIVFLTPILYNDFQKRLELEVYLICLETNLRLRYKGVLYATSLSSTCSFTNCNCIFPFKEYFSYWLRDFKFFFCAFYTVISIPNCVQFPRILIYKLFQYIYMSIYIISVCFHLYIMCVM